MEITETAKTVKKKTKSYLRIFLTTSSPPIKTNGSMMLVPIHQLAAPKEIIDGINTEIATGLKICFLFIENKYFETIARIGAIIRNGNSEKFLKGVIIKIKISAVMYTDSRFVIAFKNFAKSVFVIHETRTIIVVEIIN